jgi:CRP-like cAMP-binding protein
MTTIESLRNMECLELLTDEQISKLAEIAQVEIFKKENYVEVENNSARALYIVKQGRVAIEVILPIDRHVSVYIVKPGDLFGWSAVVSPYQVTASSLCMEDCEIVVFPKEKILSLLDSDVALKASFMEVITRVIRNRLKDTRQQMSYLLSG